MKALYLYRAVATITELDVHGDPAVWPGMTIGRSTGYLSRSSAKIAGAASGIPFKVIHSRPVVFDTPVEVKQAERIAELEEQLADLKPLHLRAV